MLEKNQKEQRMQAKVVRVSAVVSIVIFLIALSAGIISDSITLLLDASAGFITILMAFVLHFNLKKMGRPPDQFYNFGYDKFEPFTVAMQGSMIMLTCVIALYFAIQDIVHADDIARYDIPMYAAVVAGFLALFTSVYLKRISLKTSSHMLRVSSLHWLVDALFSFAMMLGFGFGFYLHRKGYSHLTPYVDPAMTIILAAILIWTPIRLLKRSLAQLLDAAPTEEVRREVEKIVEKHKVKAFGIHNIRMRNAGEKIFLYICFDIHRDTTMIQAQEFEKVFEEDIARKFPKYDVIVYFYPALDQA
ncbi:MAG: cation diffusion facilitator family transporter [Candidatus Omnitrophota bacterium]